MYGHTDKLAREIAKGLEKSGCIVKLYQVHETLSEDILIKMHAPRKSNDVPFINETDLPTADGILFGFPTYFGSVPAQIKTLMDSVGRVYMKSGDL